MAGAPGHRLEDLSAVPAQEFRSRLTPAVLAKEPAQIIVVGVGVADGVALPFQTIVLAQGLAVASDGEGSSPAAQDRFGAAQLLHQPVYVAQLLERVPPLVPLSPVGAWSEPDRKGLGKVLRRV